MLMPGIKRSWMGPKRCWVEYRGLLGHAVDQLTGSCTGGVEAARGCIPRCVPVELGHSRVIFGVYLAAISHTARFCGEPRSAAVMESHSTARNRLRDRVVGVAEEHIADRSRCWRIAPPGCCATCVEKGCWVAAENFSSGARRRPLRRFASKDRLSSVPATRAVR